MYQIVFMARRLASVVVLVFMEQWPFFQCSFLMIFSTLNLAYLVANQPMLTKFDNYMNIFNEVSITLFTHLMTTILNIAIPESLVNQLGWFLIVVATFNIMTNLILMGFSSF